MKKITYLLLLIFSLASTNISYGYAISANASESSDSNLMGKALTVATVSAVAAGGYLIYQGTIMGALNHYVDEPEGFDSYVLSNLNRSGEIEEQVYKRMAKANSEEKYLKYKRLADMAGFRNIPPYEKHDGLLDRMKGIKLPEKVVNIKDKIMPHPKTDMESYIITSPSGEKIDTRLEFPIEQPATWQDYVILKKASEELAENMEKDGKGIKPAGYAAHHIVPFKEDRPFSRPYAEQARKILAAEKIGLNDSVNGVYLPHSSNVKNNTESYHREIHTGKYYQTIYNRLEKHKNNKSAIIDELNKIADDLKNNRINY